MINKLVRGNENNQYYQKQRSRQGCGHSDYPQNALVGVYRKAERAQEIQKLAVDVQRAREIN